MEEGPSLAMSSVDNKVSTFTRTGGRIKGFRKNTANPVWLIRPSAGQPASTILTKQLIDVLQTCVERSCVMERRYTPASYHQITSPPI